MFRENLLKWGERNGHYQFRSCTAVKTMDGNPLIICQVDAELRSDAAIS
ncbi:Uncharacterised protein [Sphingobacterium thalpophilum]|uniref:Uncharacterized protein n=1 Tax=Sphingobacterium thalpophilum TaxID=259 RepID=A0A4V6KSF9_9SPHI|nr:Uncharacterised protein [Sphingobacterium thalpophilum]